MRITETSDLWWKTAVVYSLDIETFNDANDDGVGDLAGLAQRIDYLADLGVTCLWLMPFFPTPDRDDGYDITDFYSVDPRLGTLGDMVEVIRTCHDRGLRVIFDLVVNHTSDQHPWFKQARSSRDNPFHDWYVWRDTEPPDTSAKVVFPGEEDSIWEFNEPTGEWYLHNFYTFQPDLNITNPLVRDEIAKIIGFWTQLGFDGFRMDAVPFLIDPMGARPAEKKAYGDPLDYLRSLRSLVARRTGDGILLGEVNIPYKDQAHFFGDDRGDGLNMMFDFIGMQHIYLSLAREGAAPLTKALQDRPKLPQVNQFANFMRNHDELTLDKLTKKQRQECFDAFGPDPDMQVYDRGLKRRLAPMLGDPRRLRMVMSLVFTLPGTPAFYYGDEIGMGEYLPAKGRMAVRTPMQWTAQSSAGFSALPPEKLISPFPGGGFGPEHVNVADQRRDPDSLLSFFKELIFRYRQHPEIGWGEFEVLDQPYQHVLAHSCSYEGNAIIAVHNLSAEGVTVPLTLRGIEDGSRLVDVFDGSERPASGTEKIEIRLDGYGFAWFRLQAQDDRRLY